MATLQSSNHGKGKWEVTFKVDSEEEMDAIKAAEMGAKWITVEDGKFRSTDKIARVPEPDAKCELHFTEGPAILIAPEKGKPYDPAIFVEHIQGYSGDWDGKARKMEKAGFELLRSRRGKDGKIWEVWFLPSTWFADGPIKGFKKAEILSWLFQVISPGNVTVAGEHWGLSID